MKKTDNYTLVMEHPDDAVARLDELTAENAALKARLAELSDHGVWVPWADHEILKNRLAEAARDARHARELCWLLVVAAGGEIRIPNRLIIRFDPSTATLERYEPMDKSETVYRTAGGTADQPPASSNDSAIALLQSWLSDRSDEAEQRHSLTEWLAGREQADQPPPVITFPEDMSMAERIGDPRIDSTTDNGTQPTVRQEEG